MCELTVSLGCCDYDRTRAIFDGRVAIKGCNVISNPIEPEEAFHRAFKFQEFDISVKQTRESPTQVRVGLLL